MFKKNTIRTFKRTVAMLLAAAAIVCSALFVISCGEEETTTAGETTAPVSFSLVVVKLDGSEKTHSVTTTETTLAAALIKEGIIEGEEGQYGFVVQVVDGERHYWEEDGKYWAIYIGDEYASVGISSIIPEEGKVYKLDAPTLPIGILSDTPRKSIRFRTHPGDVVVMVSDGVTMGNDECPWLLDLLSSPMPGSMDSLRADIIKRALSAGSEDDLSAIAIRVKE